MRRTYDQAVKLPKSFVESFAQARSEALIAWQSAREASDFGAFKPALTHLIALTKEKIELLGITSTPYDVLLDEYEVGMTVEDYDPLFAGFGSVLVPLLHAITKRRRGRKSPCSPRICGSRLRLKRPFARRFPRTWALISKPVEWTPRPIRFPQDCGPATPGSPLVLMRQTRFPVFML